MALEPFLIETPRLRLRYYVPEDLDRLAPILGDAETMSFYPGPFSREATRSWIERNIRRYREDGHGLYAIEDRTSGEFLGNCGPVMQFVDGIWETELGWHVKRSRWRQGIATEAAAACRDHAWGDLGVKRLIALVRPENVASRGVAENVGMTVDKEISWGPLEQPHLVYAMGSP
jgi:RimJ/RimL family protein N-acetyltransferase